MAASTPNLDPLPSTMRAVVLHDAKGGLDALRIEERAVPKAGPGEVLVKIAASPVNPSSRPAITFRSEDLPEPFEPMTPILAPG